MPKLRLALTSSPVTGDGASACGKNTCARGQLWGDACDAVQPHVFRDFHKQLTPVCRAAVHAHNDMFLNQWHSRGSHELRMPCWRRQAPSSEQVHNPEEATPINTCRQFCCGARKLPLSHVIEDADARFKQQALNHPAASGLGRRFGPWLTSDDKSREGPRRRWHTVRAQ